MLKQVKAYKVKKSPAKAKENPDNGKENSFMSRSSKDLKASYIILVENILCKVVSEITSFCALIYVAEEKNRVKARVN